MSIQLLGCEDHITIPVTVFLQNNKQVKFKVDYDRMTRSDAKKANKVAFDRQKEITMLSNLMVEATTLEAKLQTMDDDNPEKPSIQKKLKGKLNSQRIEDRIFEINEQADIELRSRIKGWSGIKDAKGKSLPFSDDALDIMMNSAPYHAALNKGQFEATGELVKN